MTKRIIILLSFLLMTACAGTKNIPLDRDEISRLNAKTITVTMHSNKPNFASLTPGKALFGVLGTPSQIIMGNKLINDHNVADPAEYMKQVIVDDLAKKYNLSVKDNNNADILLDIRTTDWLVSYFRTNWDRYRVTYEAQIKLIDLNNKKIISKGFCKIAPNTIAGQPTYKELVADHAKRLKSDLQNAANICIEKFRSEILAL